MYNVSCSLRDYINSKHWERNKNCRLCYGRFFGFGILHWFFTIKGHTILLYTTNVSTWLWSKPWFRTCFFSKFLADLQVLPWSLRLQLRLSPTCYIAHIYTALSLSPAEPDFLPGTSFLKLSPEEPLICSWQTIFLPFFFFFLMQTRVKIIIIIDARPCCICQLAHPFEDYQKSSTW